jgi:hypothetical protein
MPLPWERQWNTGPALPPDDDSVQSYITDAATKRGIPVEDALRVWAGEGKGAWQSNFRKRGVREPSYGPYQLYKGGGLGNAFMQDTGLDPADPSTWKQGVDYALDTAKKEGWKQWYGAPPELRSRGGYVDMESPSLGAVGARPWERKWNKVEAAPVEMAAPAAPGMAQHGISPHASTEDDLARSGISGIAGLFTGLAGMLGEIERFGESFLPEDMRGADLPGVEDIRAIETPFGKISDFDYDPKTAGGKVTQSVIPYTMAAGKASLLNKAKNVATVYAGGKVGEAVGGDAGEIIGATLAGGRTGMPKTPKGHKDTAAAFAEGTKQYKVPEKLGVDINGRRFYAFAHNLKKDKDIQSLLREPNLEGSLRGAVGKMLDAVEGPPAPKYVGVGKKVTPPWNPRNMSIKEYDEWRRSISKYLGKEDANVRRQAKIVISKMDKHFGKKSNLTGTPANKQKALDSLPKAREAWRRGKQSKRLDSFNRLAENRAVGLTGSGRDNAIRLEYKKLIDKIDRSDVEKNKWSKDEIATIRKIARVGSIFSPRRILRTVGRFNPMGLGGFGYAGYGYATGDTEGALGAAGLTLGSRALAGSLAARRARALQELTLAGGKKVSDPTQILRGTLGGYLGSQ